MNRFETNLRRVLRLPEPPTDLTARVLAAAERPARRPFLPTSVLRTAAGVVLIAGLAAGGLHYQHVRAERVESERARDQVIQAFRLAGEQLKPFQKQLEEMQMMTIPIPEGEK